MSLFKPADEISSTVAEMVEFGVRFVFSSDETVPENHSLVIPSVLGEVLCICHPDVVEQCDYFEPRTFITLMNRFDYIRTEAARGSAKNNNGWVTFDKRRPLLKHALNVFKTQTMKELGDEKNALLLSILTRMESEQIASTLQPPRLSIQFPKLPVPGEGCPDWRLSEDVNLTVPRDPDTTDAQSVVDAAFNAARRAAFSVDSYQHEFWRQYGLSHDMFEHICPTAMQALSDERTETAFAFRWKEMSDQMRIAELVWATLGTPLRNVLLSGACSEKSANYIVKEVSDAFLTKYHGGKARKWSEVRVLAANVLEMLKRRYRAGSMSSRAAPLTTTSTSPLIEILRQKSAEGAVGPSCWFADVCDLPSDLSSNLDSTLCLIVNVDSCVRTNEDQFELPSTLTIVQAEYEYEEYPSITWDSFLETSSRSCWPVPIVYLLRDKLRVALYGFEKQYRDSERALHKGRILQHLGMHNPAVSAPHPNPIAVRPDSAELQIRTVENVSNLRGTFGSLEQILCDYGTVNAYTAQTNMKLSGCCMITPCECGRCD